MLRAACVVLLLLPVIASAADKPAWEWTDAERIAARLDPRNLEARVRANAAADPEATGLAFVIDGSRDPALFLPAEVMDMLLASFSFDGNALGEPDRIHLQAPIESFGWDPGVFWSDVRLAANEYFAAMQEQRSSKATDAISRKICSSRIKALRTIREKYERFDEFLYRVIAPRSTLGGSRAENEESLRWRNGACD